MLRENGRGTEARGQRDYMRVESKVKLDRTSKRESSSRIMCNLGSNKFVRGVGVCTKTRRNRF